MAKKEILELETEEAVALATEKAESMSGALELKINSTPTFTQASKYMADLREVKKFLKEKKDSVLKPLKVVKENFEALFEPAEEKVAEVENYLKEQIFKYNISLQAEQRTREEEAAKRVKEGAPIEKVVQKVENTARKIDAIPTRKVWKIKIIDFEKVPNDFKLLDESKARKAAEAGIKIDGLEFVQEQVIVNRF